MKALSTDNDWQQWQGLIPFHVCSVFEARQLRMNKHFVYYTSFFIWPSKLRTLFKKKNLWLYFYACKYKYKCLQYWTVFSGLRILSFSVTHAQFSVLNTYNRNMSVATENRKHVQYLTCTCTLVFSTFTCWNFEDLHI